MRFRYVLILVTLCFGLSVRGEDSQIFKVSEDEKFTYTRPSGLPFVTNFFKDFGLFYERYLDREHAPYILGIAAATAVTIYYDEDLLLGAQDWGRKLHISSKDKTKTFFSVFNFNVRFPTDLGSAMYFIGDGWTHLSVGAGFLAYGVLANDYRAWSTSYAIFEGLLTTGVTTQFLKHITGRESPGVRTKKGGRWELFPNQIRYHKDVPAFDAYPSGHLATGTMTLTVVAENYPEYVFIKPLGITLLTLLSFQMMNNGVHWFSDYPLAIGLGYAMGEIAVSNYRKIEKASFANKTRKHVEPLYLYSPLVAGNSFGVSMKVMF